LLPISSAVHDNYTGRLMTVDRIVYIGEHNNQKP
jgi:hypothetical protein